MPTPTPIDSGKGVEEASAEINQKLNESRVKLRESAGMMGSLTSLMAQSEKKHKNPEIKLVNGS